MQNIMAIMATLALGHSLFLAIFFWSKKNGRRLSNHLLAYLLLALAIRVTKSVLIVMFPASGAWAPWFGLVGMAAIGPLLLLYLFSVLDFSFTWSGKQWLHFIFPALLLVFFPLLDDPAVYRCYQVSVAQMLGYLLFSAYFLIKNLPALSPNEDLKRWLSLLTAAVAAVWAVFFIQLHVETEATYVLVTTCATTVLYGLSFWGMGRMGLFSKNRVNGKSLPAEATDLARQIRSLFENEKIARDKQLTVSRLAKQLKVPPYQVSRVVNESFGKTFPELLNEYRVADCAERLLQHGFDHLSIEGIAYESGFHSLSAFYAAFKKIHGATPAEWRRKQSLS